MTARHRPAFAPMIENLESRQFLSVSLAEGTLQIIGTHKADNILVTIDSKTPDQIYIDINRFVRRFALSDVENIYIQGGQGDDFIRIDPGKRKIDMPTRIYGSGGVDTLEGGVGRDRIYGGGGSDRIDGNDSRDIIYGEAGADRIDGGQGADVIDGGDDNDTLTGGTGVDRILGGPGDDTLNAKDGFTDNVNGGPNTDSADADKTDDLLVSIEKLINPRT